MTIDPVKNAYRKCIERAQQKGVTYNEKLLKFSKQMKSFHLAQRTTRGGSPPRPPTPPSPDNYTYNPKYDLLPLNSPNVVSYPEIEPEKEKPRDKSVEIEPRDLLSTACKSLFFEEENPPAILSDQTFLDDSSCELSINATCSGPFQDDSSTPVLPVSFTSSSTGPLQNQSSRLMSRRETPVIAASSTGPFQEDCSRLMRRRETIPVSFPASSTGPFQDDPSRLMSRSETPVIPVIAENLVDKTVQSTKKGGEGRRIGEDREDLTNESKKLLKRKAEIIG